MNVRGLSSLPETFDEAVVGIGPGLASLASSGVVSVSSITAGGIQTSDMDLTLKRCFFCKAIRLDSFYFSNRNLHVPRWSLHTLFYSFYSFWPYGIFPYACFFTQSWKLLGVDSPECTFGKIY